MSKAFQRHRCESDGIDAYTFLGLKSSNEWSIQASLYKSADIFASLSSVKKDKKVDSFFDKKKKDEGNWRSLEWE